MREILVSLDIFKVNRGIVSLGHEVKQPFDLMCWSMGEVWGWPSSSCGYDSPLHQGIRQAHHEWRPLPMPNIKNLQVFACPSQCIFLLLLAWLATSPSWNTFHTWCLGPPLDKSIPSCMNISPPLCIWNASHPWRIFPDPPFFSHHTFYCRRLMT